MNNPLPSNQQLIAFSDAISWERVETYKQRFNEALQRQILEGDEETLNLVDLSEAVGAPVRTYYESAQPGAANVIFAEVDGYPLILGGYVSARYRSGKSLLRSITPYHLNPSVNHTNIDQTDDHTERMRALGAEIELGLVHSNGASPTEEEMQAYIRTYYDQAQRLGIYPRLDREACQYQVEAHLAPSIGYHRTREALRGIMTALAAASEITDLRTAIMSSYPTLSDFKMSEDPKVQTAIDLMVEVNTFFPEYAQRLADAHDRYHIPPGSCHHVEMFRIQGCHIHIDLAGRSEGLGLLTFYTMLRSATAIANAAVLKGGPFVNGTCDPELLCVREHVRRTTVTGRHLDLPLSPHFWPEHMDLYAYLLQSERVNAVARAQLCNTDTPDQPVSAMHNPVGRLRPDLATSKRVCTVESTGMPANISVSRMAAVLTDFEFSHTVIEHYFRQHGCDLEPMYNDRLMWAVLGPLDRATFERLHDASDRECTDVVITTAAGTEMTLAEFYEMKRLFMHKALADIIEITPRDVDDVYTSLIRMLNPPSGKSAQTIEQFVSDPKLRSTGNWGRILRNAYIEAGGTPGSHHPDIVLKIVNDIHDAMKKRYLMGG